MTHCPRTGCASEPARADRSRERADRCVPRRCRRAQPRSGSARPRRSQARLETSGTSRRLRGVYLALGCRNFHADPSGDLVAHTGVPVLDVIALALRIARAPRACADRPAPSRRRTRSRRVSPAASLIAPMTAAWAGMEGSVDRRDQPGRFACPTPPLRCVRAAPTPGRRASSRANSRTARPPRARRRPPVRPACLPASNAHTLRFTNRTLGSANADFDAVVKSLQRVPIPMTTVGVARCPVRRGRARRAYGPERQGMLGDERAAARLGLAYGDPGRLDQFAQGANASCR